MKEKTETK